MTFRELDLYVRGALEHEARMVITGSWLGAAWERAKTMPTLQSALGDLMGPRRRRRSSWQEQLEYVKAFLQPAFGGEMQPTAAPASEAAG